MIKKVNYLEKLALLAQTLNHKTPIEKALDFFIKECSGVFLANFSFIKLFNPNSLQQDSFAQSNICYFHDGKFFFIDANEDSIKLLKFYDGLGTIHKLLSSREVILWPSQIVLQPSELNILKNRNISALTIVPVNISYNQVAVLWLESGDSEAAIDEEKINFIKTAASLLGAYFEKMLSEIPSDNTQIKKFNFENAVNDIFSANDQSGRSKIPELQHTLVKNHLRYQQLLNNEKQILFTLDTAGNVTTVSKFIEEMTGYSASELINQNIFEDTDGAVINISQEYRPLVKKMFDLKVAGKLDNTSYEIEIISKSGKPYSLEVNSSAVSLNGKVMEIMVAAKNITEQKYDNKVLTAILNSSSEGIMVLKSIRNANKEITDFEIQVLNKAAEKLLGKNAGDMIGRKLLTEIPESIENKLFERYVKTAETGFPLNYEQFYELDKNEFWLRITANKLDDGIIINFSDVSYQKQAEKELQEKIHFNETLLDSIPYPVILINEKKQILSMNKAASKFGETLCDMCHDIFDKYFATEWQSGAFENLYKLNAIEISGQLWNVNIIHIYEDIHIFYAINISDLIEKTACSEKSKYAELTVNALQQGFLSMISHEIRTPLNSIIGFSELLNETPLNLRQTEYLSFIRSSSSLLLNVINDMIDYACLVSDNFILQEHDFNILKIVNETIEMVMPQIKSKYLKLTLDMNKNIPTYIFGDSLRLKQVINNLLNNAIKFTPSGEIKLIIKIENETPEALDLYIEVKDYGIGIANGNIEKIFEPFTQADNSYTRKYGGNGLGLSLSNSIVKLMGGKRIYVKSKPEAGSSFYFTLPLKKPINKLPQPSLNY